MISYGENRPFVCRTSRDHRDDDSTRLRRYGRHGSHEMREANADSLRREQCPNVRHSQDSNGDIGGLFALYARRFYADWRTVRQRHGNNSVERDSLGRVRARAGGNDVESGCVQRGISRFAGRSRKLRLPVAILRRIET